MKYVSKGSHADKSRCETHHLRHGGGKDEVVSTVRVLDTTRHPLGGGRKRIR